MMKDLLGGEEGLVWNVLVSHRPKEVAFGGER